MKQNMEEMASHLLPLKIDSFIIDIGCYEGEFIDELLKTGRYRFVGFEPNPEKYQTLKNKYSDSKNIFIENLALGNFKGMKKFYIKGLGSSFFQSWTKSSDSLEVSVEKLSDYLEGRIPDVVKINCEGSEYEIIHDLNKILSQIEKIFVQFHKIKPLYKDNYGKIQNILGVFHDKIYSFKTWELWKKK